MIPSLLSHKSSLISAYNARLLKLPGEPLAAVEHFFAVGFIEDFGAAGFAMGFPFYEAKIVLRYFAAVKRIHDHGGEI